MDTSNAHDPWKRASTTLIPERGSRVEKVRHFRPIQEILIHPPKHDSVSFSEPPEAVFQAALGVLQNAKNATLLAAHNGGGRLIAREKPKMSNAKFVNIQVDGEAAGSQLHVVIGTDPRNPKALLDGKANAKSLKNFVENVRGALDGSKPAPASPVTDHFLQKKTEMPWSDPTQDPEIELDGNIRAAYGL